MSKLLNTFQHRHQEKLNQLEHGEDEEALLDGVHILIFDLRQAGAVVADPAERGRLRALIRFWANVAYEHAGVYLDTTLLPLDPANVRPSEEPSRRAWPPLIWVLVGGAAAVIVATGLVAIGWLSSRPRQSVEAISAPTPVLAPSVRYAIVEVMTGGGLATDSFCFGTSDVVAKFTLKDVQPETVWYWELQRESEVVDAQPAAAWGLEGEQASLAVLTGGPQGVPPGKYDLLAYAEEQVVGTRSFQVLATPPIVTNLQVTDIPPMMGGEVTGKSEFDAGIKVIYLSYDYEGLCPGFRVSHKLYHQGELVQESVMVWSGDSQGRAQIGLQSPSGQPFLAGGYEIVAAVAGEEQGRVSFTVGEAAEEKGEVVGPPAFDNITVAMGVQPDGTPILAGGPFGWGTRVVHAIFDCEGMGDGVRWSVVWARDGEEIAREDHVWSAESVGHEGTYWVALDNAGEHIGGGSYTVTLYINGQQEGAVDFQIYYEPEE